MLKDNCHKDREAHDHCDNKNYKRAEQNHLRHAPFLCPSNFGIVDNMCQSKAIFWIRKQKYSYFSKKVI
jgi:hypothetical protein